MKVLEQWAAIGAVEQQKRIDIIANNLANTDTPGFKKDSPVFKDYLLQGTYTQMDPGTLQATGVPLNVAINGEGFFRVQTPNGGVAYTRAGNFSRSNNGTLTTQEGWPIIGQGGPIQLTGEGEVRIDSSGQVYVGKDRVGALDIAQFPKGTALTKIGNQCFQPSDSGATPTTAENFTLEQGMLEGSNFTTVSEMSQMIDALRTFESYQKMLQTSNSDYSQLISKLGV